MAYVECNPDRTIKGVYGPRQPTIADEEIDDAHPGVIASRSRAAPPPGRDLAAEIDALKADLARAKATEAALIAKGTITRGDVDARVEIVVTPGGEAAKP